MGSISDRCRVQVGITPEVMNKLAKLMAEHKMSKIEAVNGILDSVLTSNGELLYLSMSSELGRKIGDSYGN